MRAPLPERLERDPESPDELRDLAAGIVVVCYGPERETESALTLEMARRWNAHAALVELLERYVRQEKTAAPYSASPMRAQAEAALRFAREGSAPSS